jgi:hypothetical protein
MSSNYEMYEKGEKNMAETPQELIENTINRVEDFLKKNFPDYISFENGTFTVSRGTIQVMIIVRPFTESETCVEFVATVVTGAIIDPTLMQFLLRKNSELHYGAFALLFDGTIVFQHSIAGTNVDENEVRTSLNAVAIITDYYGKEIITMAGGMLASEEQADEEI